MEDGGVGGGGWGGNSAVLLLAGCKHNGRGAIGEAGGGGGREYGGEGGRHKIRKPNKIHMYTFRT